MYLVCSVDIWHSQYLWCFSLWPSQVKRFIYEDTFMQDFILVHFAEIVYSNKKPTMKTVLKGFTGDGREILFLPVFAKPNSLLQHSSAEVGLSLQLSQCPNVPQHGQPTMLQSQPILWSSSPMSTSSFRSNSSPPHPTTPPLTAVCDLLSIGLVYYKAGF